MSKSNSTDFPYPSFPIRLEFKEGKQSRVCYFQEETNLKKYLTRHKINKKTADIRYNEKT
jgi:hypothetical protein